MNAPDTPSQRTAQALLELSLPPRRGFLERRGWWVWFLGIAVTVAFVGSLVAVAFTMSRLPGSDSLDSQGSNNQPVLMVVLVLTILLFIGYVTYQQHMVMASRRRHQHRRLLGILTVSRTMGAENDPQQILNGIIEICRRTYDCDQVSLMKIEGDQETLVVCSASGHTNLQEVLGSRVKIGEGIAGWVAEHREPLILGPKVDPSRFQGMKTKGYKVASAMIVPILLRNELFGVLSVSCRSRRIRYDEEDLETLLVFAETAGIVSRHAEQSSWMRQTIQRLDGELLKQRGPLRRVA